MIVKPGYKTTELLATVLASVGAWLAAWDGTLAPKWAAIATSISTAAYAASRAITKHGVATGPAKIVPVVPAQPATVATPPVASGPQAI